MIVVHLISGFGNQLFQYAVGRHLEIRTGEDLYFDITGFKKYKLHHYSLQHFNIKERFVSEADLKKRFCIGRSGIYGIFSRWIEQRKPHYQRHMVYELKNHIFDPEILKLKGDIYLKGYWQSENYFKDIEEVIKKEVSLAIPFEEKDLEVAEKICSCDSVGLHIRRKDYVTNVATNAKFGTCNLEYYHSCIDRITTSVPTAYFFVFSDDPDWAAQNLQIDHPFTVVDHNDASRNYADITLMSLCKHNIIANSSFSWWGAWLNKNPGKMVFAPKRWFATEEYDTPDLIPKTWTMV